MEHIRPALVLILLFTALTGLALPLGFVGLGAVALPLQAGGSLVERGGVVVGSALIGQAFTGDRFFQGRPSATTTSDLADASKQVPAPYNAASSAASNLAATSAALISRVKEDVAKVGAPVPGDEVTTSASGLDPHISPETVLRQVARVAKARGLPEMQVRDAVAARTEGRLLGVIGEPRVNVLLLNMDLDRLQPR